MMNSNFNNQTSDLSVYTMDELIDIYKMIETMGSALSDTFTINADVRPLARYADVIDQILGELDRLVIGESVNRERAERATDNVQEEECPESPDWRGALGEPNYVFRYGKE